MDQQTARALSDMNTAFYARVSGSFSATRQAPWDGWRRLLDVVGFEGGNQVSVFDLACGNLRFERFLAESGLHVDVWAVDNCDGLVALGMNDAIWKDARSTVTYQHVDVIDALLSDRELRECIDAPACDLVVSFGFMHHVPTFGYREELLRTLVGQARLGGVVALSFWQFAQDERLLRKALPVEGGDEGDYLLGWQNQDDARRYCHSFSENEIDRLVLSCQGQAQEIARYSADGKTGTLNRYLLLQRC